MRSVQSLLFEAGRPVLLVPFIAWHMDVTLWRAPVIDLSLPGVCLVYAASRPA